MLRTVRMKRAPGENARAQRVVVLRVQRTASLDPVPEWERKGVRVGKARVHRPYLASISRPRKILRMKDDSIRDVAKPRESTAENTWASWVVLVLGTLVAVGASISFIWDVASQ